MDIQLTLAVIIGKLIVLLTRLFGSGATAAPGLYALKIDPDLVRKLSKKIKYGSIIISGTNGKTTTSKLVYDILSSKYKIIHNRQGSNLLRGIASTLISKSTIFGKISFNLALWEVDEAILNTAIINTNPKTIVLLNLFRDQLDRYGEVDSIRTSWQKILQGYTLNRSITLILNIDDPGIYQLSKCFKGQTFSFGIENGQIDLPKVNDISDIKHCPNCNAYLIINNNFSAHLGHYSCPKCNFKRPKPQIYAKNIFFKENFRTSFSLTINHKLFTINYDLPGLYNIYNILAATATSFLENIQTKIIVNKIKQFTTAFGRYQKIEVGKKTVFLFLIKNPVGANEVLRILTLQKKINILAILNDNFADGKDISWIWDTNWELIKNNTNKIFVSGLRCWDLALRLKYAGIKLSNNNIHKDINYSIINSLRNMNNKDTLIILPTYTALLKVQNALTKITKNPKWHNQ